MSILPSASIVVNTYNRVVYLHRLLLSLRHLNSEKFEVVVVNGPSTDGTDEMLAKFEGQVKLMRCPEANLSRSRNMGIAAAAGEVVVFIDDDAIPGDPGWLRRLLTVFAEDADGTVGAVGGPALHRDTKFYEYRGGFTSDYGEQVFRREDCPDISGESEHWVQRTVGCNSAFRRSALVKIGGFDEHLVYYLDETDVCWRLAQRGYDIVYLDDCPVRHYSTPALQDGVLGRTRRVVAQSDTYFALKNGLDPQLRRLLRTLRLAPAKHFVTELHQWRRDGRLSTCQWCVSMLEWLRGLVSGLSLGLFAARGNNLLPLEPVPFMSFASQAPADKLSVCLLSRDIPPASRIGGVGRYTYDLARGLHELGHEVHVICQSDQEIRWENLDFTIHGITPADLRIEGLLFPEIPVLDNSSRYAVAVGRKLQQLQQQGVTFDVIHASNWDLEGLTLPMFNCWPHILFLVSPLAEVAGIQRWHLGDALRRMVALDKWQIEQAPALCCPSEGVKDAYRTSMCLSPTEIARMQRVQLGIFTERQVVSPSSELPRRLLFVGRLERRKGIHSLLAVLPQLLQVHPDWQCDLVGNDRIPDADGGLPREWFQERYAGQPWLSRVHFHGAVSDQALQDFYRRCDIFVAPSLFESFGLVYLEAMQYGKPVVGCQVGGIPEIVAHGTDGLLVPPGDEFALAEALERLMTDAGLRRELGQAGRDKVQTQYNHVAMAQRMLVQYRQVIAAWRQEGNHERR